MSAYEKLHATRTPFEGRIAEAMQRAQAVNRERLFFKRFYRERLPDFEVKYPGTWITTIQLPVLIPPGHTRVGIIYEADMHGYSSGLASGSFANIYPQVRLFEPTDFPGFINYGIAGLVGFTSPAPTPAPNANQAPHSWTKYITTADNKLRKWPRGFFYKYDTSPGAREFQLQVNGDWSVGQDPGAPPTQRTDSVWFKNQSLLVMIL